MFKRRIEKKSYWLFIIATALAMLAIALYYQHILQYEPCLLCIHLRLYTLGFILLALLGLSSSKKPSTQKTLHLLSLGLSIGFTERALNIFAVESGFASKPCDMNLDLPTWLALDKWLPSVFSPLEPCGYTPELIFGVSMAQALVAIGILTITFSGYQIFKK